MRLLLCSLALISVLTAHARQRETIWTGVFSEAQAERGKKAFVENCARCHVEDLSGKNGPPLKGEKFFEKWRESDLEILFSTVKTMPPSTARNPVARLPEATSLDILTHILRVNGAAAGAQDLKVEALRRIQFEKSTGPEAVPNLSLVRVVGCVAQATPAAWSVAAASDPVRAMNPEVLSAEEKAAAGATTAGSNSYRLSQIDYIDKPIAEFKDRRVLIKGTLIRADNGTRINLMAMEIIENDRCSGQ